jgi:cobalt/nickel transport system permease protein
MPLPGLSGVMNADIPSFLLKKAETPSPAAGGKFRSVSYIDHGITGFARIIQDVFIQWELASHKGFLHELDSRAKILFWIVLLVVISLKNTVFGLLIIAMALALLIVISRVNPMNLYGRVIPLSLFFGFLVSAPAMLNIVSPGTIVVPIIELSRPYSFWIYSVPQHIGITEEGVAISAMLTLRVFDSLTLSFLILATTPFTEIVRALKLFRVPDTLLLILTLTYKYVYLFSRVIADMYRAKKARLVLGISASEFRKWSAGRMALVFRKTEQRVEDIYNAMVCRGFSGEIRLMGETAIRTSDVIGALALASFVLAVSLV